MFCLGLKFPDYNPGAIVCCKPSGVGERSLEEEGREGGGGGQGGYFCLLRFLSVYLLD